MKISKSSLRRSGVKIPPKEERGTFYSWIYDRENVRRVSRIILRVSKKRLRKLKRNNNLANKNETTSNTCMYIHIYV